MLGGLCSAWLVLVAPVPSAPLDPFADASPGSREMVAVRGDLVDPFARPVVARPTADGIEGAPAHRVRSSSFDLKDPFAPPSSVGRRRAPRAASVPDLADPFARPGARPVAVSADDEPPCAAVRASNGAKVQRPHGIAPSRCATKATRGPQLRNPFD